jgi:hypothetical protein
VKGYNHPHPTSPLKGEGTLRYMEACFMYCPIREISVERGGTRVKKFNVFEPRYFRGELLNFRESRQSGTPGDFTGASFWYFLREKVLRVLGAEPRTGFMDLRNRFPPSRE